MLDGLIGVQVEWLLDGGRMSLAEHGDKHRKQL